MGIKVIPKGIREDETFAHYTDFEMNLWFAILGTLTDDQGRFQDNAAVIRAHAFPFRDDLTVEDMRHALDHFVSDGKLIRYELNGKAYLQDTTVWEAQHPQWAARSKYPAPEGWTDRVRTRENNKYVESGWDSVGGFGVQVNTSPERHARVRRVSGTNPYPYPQPQGQEPYIAQVRAARLEVSESDIEDADFLEVDEVCGEVVEESSYAALVAEKDADVRRLFAKHPADTAGGAAR